MVLCFSIYVPPSSFIENTYTSVASIPVSLSCAVAVIFKFDIPFTIFNVIVGAISSFICFDCSCVLVEPSVNLAYIISLWFKFVTDAPLAIVCHVPVVPFTWYSIVYGVDVLIVIDAKPLAHVSLLNVNVPWILVVVSFIVSSALFPALSCVTTFTWY